MSDNWMPEAKLLASFDHHISVLQERIANDKRHIANLRAQRVEAVESGAELRGQGSS